MPERVTEYEYDDRDRVVRSREWVESPWDEDQRGLVLAYMEWEASRCPACGGDPAECQSPDADPHNPYAKWIYRAELPAECYVSSAARSNAPDPADKRALIPRVRRVPRGTPSAFRR